MVRKRKIIVSIATSADGFIARRDGSVDWLDRPRPKGNYGMGPFYESIDAILRSSFRRKALLGRASIRELRTMCSHAVCRHR
jgi:dihydrofolate reductase